MTLALYGKSKRRRGTLLLVALLAVTLAILGGVTYNNSESAGAAPKPPVVETPGPLTINPDHINATNPGFKTESCPAPNPPAGKESWWAWHFVVPSGDFSTLNVTFANAGIISGSVPTADVIVSHPDASHAYVWTPGPDKLTAASATGTGNDKFNLSHVCPGSTRQVQFQKFTTTADHPGGTFTIQTSPTLTGGVDLTLAPDAAASAKSSPKNIPLTAESLSETAPASWTLNGYEIKTGIVLSALSCSTGDAFASGSTIAAVAAGSATNVLVCAKNTYASTPPPPTTMEVTVWKVAATTEAQAFSGTLDSAGADPAWSVTGTNSGSGPHTVAPGSVTVSENPVAGWSRIGGAIAIAPTAACSTTKADYVAASNVVTVVPGQITKICVYNEKDAIVIRDPNLTVTKTAIQNGVEVDQVVVSSPFNWVVTIANSGGSNAVFTNGQDILHDTPPIGNYGTISAAVGNGTTGNVSCGWLFVYYCEASGTVTIPPGGTITVTLTVPSGFSLPGNKTNTCLVDPSNNPGGFFKPPVDAVDESNEGDNTCSDTVEVINQQITFSKFICPAYSAVPANAGTGDDHTGKPDDLPTGKTLGTENTTNPASPAQFAGCTESNAGWQFELYWSFPTSGDTDGGAFYSRTVSAGSTVTLNGVEATAALFGNLWVREKYRPGQDVGFGVLKCHTDQENKDNREYIDLDRLGTPNVHCIAANVPKPTTRTVQVCKVVEQNNDGHPDGGNFGGDILYPGGSDSGFDWGVTDVIEGASAVCDDITIPASGPWKLSESATSMDDALGYPMYSTNDGTAVSLGVDGKTGELGDTVTKVTFFNKAVPANNDVTIRKVVTNITGDTTPFTITPPVPLEPKPVTELPGGHHVFTVTAQAGQQFTEIVPAGYRGLGYTILTSTSQLCPDQPVVTDTTGNIAATVDAAGIADPVICFYNEAMGSVELVKVTSVAGPKDWQFISNLPALNAAISTTAPADPDNSIGPIEVPAGTYTVSELLGLLQRDSCGEGSTEANWYTTASVLIGSDVVTPEYQPGNGNVAFEVQGGKTTRIIFENRNCGEVLDNPTLFVQKMSDPQGNFTGNQPLDGWDITVVGNGYNKTVPTSGGGIAAFYDIPTGTYTVTETPKNTHVVIGSKIGVDTESGPSREVTVGLDQNETVTFYNQPNITIRVHKAVARFGATQDVPGAGWEFTVSGCGIDPVEDETDGTGTVEFTNLPPATDSCSYTITETTQPNYTVEPGVSQVVTPALGGSVADVYFRNVEVPQRCTDCAVVTTTPTASVTQPVTVTTTPTTTTPTPTTTTPTASATDPVVVTETPELTATSPASPTEATGVGSVTPQPPITGSGGGPLGGRGMSSIWLAVAGVMAIAAGLGMLSLNKRRS